MFIYLFFGLFLPTVMKLYEGRDLVCFVSGI